MVERPRGWRLSAIGVAVSLLAGLGVGFALGRASHEGDGGTAVLADAATEAARAVSPVAPVATTSVPAEWERLQVHTTADGITVRLYRQPSGCTDQPICDLWDSLVVELSNEAAVTTAYLPTLGTEPFAAQGGVFGVAEGSPTAWAVVRSDAPLVRARFEGGLAAEAAPEGGYAVLTAAPSATPGGTVEALDGAGAVVGTAEIVGSPADHEGVIELGGEPVEPPDPSFSPSPRLPRQSFPEPDGPPPADAGGAEAAVRQAYGMAFTGADSLPEGLVAVEEGSELEAALRVVQGNFPEAVRTSTVEVYEVRFRSDHEATLRFELDYTGGALFGEQFGRAVLVDGKWLVARDTYCMVMGWGGGTC